MTSITTSRADTADRILDAADALFGDQGLHGVSMRDVARHAGVPKASLFYHFGSKEELFERVLQRYYDLHRAALEGALSADLPLAERLHGLIDAYLDFIRDHRAYPRLVQREVAGTGPANALIRTNMGTLLQWTEEALSELVPASGPTSAKHLFLTIAGAVINTFTYGPALAEVWGGDPVSDDGIEERRAHLHWLVDAMLSELG